MATTLTWLGHGTWYIESDGHRILLDPFLNDNPSSPKKADEVDIDFILVSHGHFDHIADAAAIANRGSAKVLAIFEVAQWLANEHGVQDTVGMNIGGGIEMPFGRVKMTHAIHSSQLPDGSYGGNPGGFVISFPEGNVYFACDTALFSDMQLIGQQGIALAVLPIGDLFTMDIGDSIAATKLIKPDRVAPAHYNTWPPIEQDAQAWAQRIAAETDAEPVVVEPGGSITL